MANRNWLEGLIGIGLCLRLTAPRFCELIKTLYTTEYLDDGAALDPDISDIRHNLPPRLQQHYELYRKAYIPEHGTFTYRSVEKDVVAKGNVQKFLLSDSTVEVGVRVLVVRLRMGKTNETRRRTERYTIASLTVDHVRDVYRGKMREWQEMTPLREDEKAVLLSENGETVDRDYSSLTRDPTAQVERLRVIYPDKQVEGPPAEKSLSFASDERGQADGSDVPSELGDFICVEPYEQASAPESESLASITEAQPPPSCSLMDAVWKIAGVKELKEQQVAEEARAARQKKRKLELVEKAAESEKKRLKHETAVVKKKNDDEEKVLRQWEQELEECSRTA